MVREVGWQERERGSARFLFFRELSWSPPADRAGRAKHFFDHGAASYIAARELENHLRHLKKEVKRVRWLVMWWRGRGGW